MSPRRGDAARELRRDTSAQILAAEICYSTWPFARVGLLENALHDFERYLIIPLHRDGSHANAWSTKLFQADLGNNVSDYLHPARQETDTLPLVCTLQLVPKGCEAEWPAVIFTIKL